MRQRTKYYEAIRSVVKEGGDTDTNACIVGGLVGAFWGLSNINENPKNKMDYLKKIMNCKPNQKRHGGNRDRYQAKLYMEEKLIEKLLERARKKPFQKFKASVEGSIKSLKEENNRLAIENKELKEKFTNLKTEHQRLKSSNSQINAEAEVDNKPLKIETENFATLQKANKRLQTIQNYLIISLVSVKLFKTKNPSSFRKPS